MNVMKQVLEGRDWIESATEPTETEDGGPLYPGVKWLDTSSDPHVLKRRNTDNDGWVTVGSSGGSVSVEDDGTEVVAAASTLDFGTGLSVTDNGSGDVTIDLSATGDGAYAETIGDGSETSFAVTHNLGTGDVHVQVWDVSGADPVLANSDPSSVTATDEDTVTVVFGSAPSTDGYRVVVLASGSSGGGSEGGTELLARVSYNESSQTILSTSSSTFSDVDASNLAVTFDAPASGEVDVVLEASCDVSSSLDGGLRWALREGSSNVADTRRSVTRLDNFVRVRIRIPVSGLSSGSHTLKWAWARGGGTGRIIVGDDGTVIWGPAIMEVWSV